VTEFNRWSEPKTSEGKEKDRYLQTRIQKKTQAGPIIGLVFISGFTKKSDTRWENGTVYDPEERQKTYFLFFGIAGTRQDQKSRGYIGIALMGRKLHLDQKRTMIRHSFLHPLLSVVILVSNRNTSRRVWEKLRRSGRES